MKKALALAAALALVLGAASAFARPQVRLTNGEWPPYASKDLPHLGVASRIISEAFEIQGIDVQYGFFPWKRSYELARTGQWDGTVLWTLLPERTKDFFSSDVVLEGRWVFFHRKDQPFDWTNIYDLEGTVVGATLGYDYGDEFKQLEDGKVLHVERAATDEMNLQKLLAGRIQVFPLYKEVGMAMIHKNFTRQQAGRLTFHPRPLATDCLAVLFSKKVDGNRDLVDQFNRGLEKLKKSGRIDVYFQELEKSYGDLPTPAQKP